MKILDSLSSDIMKLLVVIIFLLLIILFLTALSFAKNKKIKAFENQNGIIDEILNALKPGKSLEDSLMELLVISTWLIKAPSFAFYIYDEKNSTYVLKAATSMMGGNSRINPSYSGLLPHKKESYNMPATVDNMKIPGEVRELKLGEVPLVFIPFENKKGLILIGPVSKVSSKELIAFEKLSVKINPVLESLLEIEENKNKMVQVLCSGKAVKNITNVFSDIKAMMEIILNIAIKSINASGGMLISEEKNNLQIQKIIGLEQHTQELLMRDTQTHSLLFNLVLHNEFVILSKRNKDFFKIPPYFIAENIEQLVLIKVYTENGIALAVFWYTDSLTFKEYQIAAMKILSKRMGDLVNNHINYQKISYSYVEILKTLAKLIDNLSKNTVAYSELMYRYAFIIAKEMKLPKEDIEEISLAAYLSNIGIIGLSDKLLHKKGKYDEFEYENMKLHADSGAAIIEATIGNDKVASYIRHHHERIDGYGYPAKLKGEEIPMGARIIFVVQTFLAKIVGREYRNAVSFEEALNQLKICKGTQLDETVVDIFTSWFEKKEREFKNRNHALGNCWDMRCSPENICISCPAFKNTTKNCWEFKGVNCAEHGNECESCFIHTEYLHRMKMK